MKRFVTLFPAAQNYHLTKDVGMIPYIIDLDESYTGELIVYGNTEYAYLKDEMKGFVINYIPKICHNEFIDSLVYIWKEASNIDVMNLYHWGRKTYIRSKIYKKRNKKGKLYIKLDMQENGVNILKKNRRARKVFFKIYKNADLISVESTRVKELLAALYGFDIKYIPNGFVHYSNESVEINDKENIILTVGRLGTEQKATKELIEAFCKFSKTNCDWSLVLVGSMEKSFKVWFSDFLRENPKMNKKICCVGEIIEKKLLEQYYRRAKIFALPSRWESFGLVMVEALSFGCSILSTKMVSSIDDIMNENSYVCEDSSVENIQKGLEIICNRKYDENVMKYNISKAYDNFYWFNIKKKLVEYLEG